MDDNIDGAAKHPVHHAHHEKPKISASQMPWMLVSVLLAVLLLASLYMNYSLVKSVVGGGAAAPIPSAPSQPSAPSAPAAVADIKLTATDHVRGSKDADVIIVEYSDFECPFCGRAIPSIEQVRETYGKDVAIVYRHFPLPFHPNARPAAIASECAGEQGKFWEYHDVLFENQQALSQANLIQYAKDLKLDATKFESCLKTEKYGARVDADYAQGQKDGVQGTPAFFINGKSLSGAQPFAAFKAMIDAELA